MTTPDKNAMLERVRALLAKAEATEFEAEAEALTAKATELMAKYGIDKAMAEARAHVRAVPTSKIFPVQAPYANTKNRLLGIVARALHCEPILLHTAGPDERVHVFGFESDIELVEMLYTSLLLQMSSALERHTVASYITGRRLMAERRTFMFGFMVGVRPRLEAAYALAEAEADDTGTPGKALVLASRDVAVKTALSAEYPTVRRVVSSSSGSQRSYGAGQEAGRRANIHDRPNVGTGTRALSR